MVSVNRQGNGQRKCLGVFYQGRTQKLPVILPAVIHNTQMPHRPHKCPQALGGYRFDPPFGLGMIPGYKHSYPLIVFAGGVDN